MSVQRPRDAARVGQRESRHQEAHRRHQGKNQDQAGERVVHSVIFISAVVKNPCPPSKRRNESCTTIFNENALVMQV